jgi:hypothetical protein
MEQELSREEAYRRARAILAKRYPSLDSGLNVAQYRALQRAYALDKETGNPPAINIFSFANGVGKTHLLVLDIIGWTMGKEYLRKEDFPPEAIAFYNSLSDLRDRGLLSLRLVCMADDMKPDGSVMMLLKTLFPHASLSARDQEGCHRLIDVPHPTLPGVKNSIIVKTFNQTVDKHSGSNCNRIWINEPLPDNLVGETIGRIRSQKGKIPGSIMMCATLLAGATWVQKLEDDEVMRVNHVRGHVYENCVGEDVTDKMAAEVKRTIGVQLEKAAKGYVTNGVLAAEQIQAIIALLRSTCPQELEARMSGAPITGGGRIWPAFNRAYHVVDHYNINPEWPVVQVVDPHGAKPSFTIWAQVTPMGKLYIFREWPDVDHYGYYEMLSERPHTIPQECEIWSRIEMGMGLRGAKIHRIGDPNRFKDRESYSGDTLQALFAKHGFNFDVSVSDDLAVGHGVVADYLSFDQALVAANPDDIVGLPRLFIYRDCQNTARAVENYAFKKAGKDGASVTEKVNQKYKDGADVVRYLCMWHGGKTFADMSDTSGACRDYIKFREGRLPSKYRNQYNSWTGGKKKRLW